MSSAIVVVALLVTLGLNTAALAQETTTTVAGETGTTVVGETATTATAVTYLTPAITIVETPLSVEEPPWTTKYLVPTGLALAAVLVFVTAIQYFTKVVRTRYKVVE